MSDSHYAQSLFMEMNGLDENNNSDLKVFNECIDEFIETNDLIWIMDAHEEDQVHWMETEDLTKKEIDRLMLRSIRDMESQIKDYFKTVKEENE